MADNDTDSAGSRGHAWGPPSDFGWKVCHACEILQSEFGEYEDEVCPAGGVCLREDCEWHAAKRELDSA